MRVCSIVLVLLATTISAQGGSEQRLLGSYDMRDEGTTNSASQEERAGVIDSAKLDELLNPAKIKAALTNVDIQDELFTAWSHDQKVSEVILARLRKDFKANKEIIIPYDAFRTRLTFNQVLDGWLETKTLDDIINAVGTSATSKYARMHATFAGWHKDGITTDQVSKALSKVTNKIKAKRYTIIGNLYRAYVRDVTKAT